MLVRNDVPQVTQRATKGFLLPKEDMDMQIINFLIKISGRKYEHKNNRNNYKKLHYRK